MQNGYTDTELAIELNKFMMHSAIIAKNSHSDYYQSPDYRISQMICNDYFRWLSDKRYSSLRDIAMYTVKIKAHLTGVLPCQANPSYEGSKRNIEELVTGCENYLKEKIVKNYVPHFIPTNNGNRI